MRILPFLKKSLVTICAVAVVLCCKVERLSGRPTARQQASTLADGQAEDVEQRTGPFTIGGRNYTFVQHEERLANVNDPTLARTLASVEISDAAGNVSYQKSFSHAIEQGRFSRNISASVQLISGKTGAGLVIQYRELPASAQTSTTQTNLSWQFFGLVNGKLAPLGKPMPIGEGAAGGPFMGVMMRASNGTISVTNQPDAIEVRAWTGYFYVFIPLRVDWDHGGLAQGQRCMEMTGGGLKETGCDLRVEAIRKPPVEEFAFLRLLPEAHENPASAKHVVVQKDSKVDILGARAIAIWNENGDLIQPVFSAVWLHVRIDDEAGWIHGDEDFAAVGLLAGSPAS